MENNRFQQLVLDMIDEHMEYLKSEEAEQLKNNFSPEGYGIEMKTLRIGNRRRAGYSTLVTRLAFDVGNPIGLKYSTFIISPTHEQARYNYQPDRIYFNPEDYADEMRQELARDYAAEYSHITERRPYGMGKVITGHHLDQIGFSRISFLNRQRKAIYELTGTEIDKFDLCLVDGASRLTPKQIDQMYMMFADQVELFVLLQ